MIPYGRQSIGQEDVEAVVTVLRSDWLTQGPLVERFERALADYCGAKYAVVVSSGTAALQTAYFAAGLRTGDEFITSPMTFAATCNAGIWQGAKPVFVDINPETGNIDESLIEAVITNKTKIISPIDYTGRPVDIYRIMEIARKYNLIVVEDACHALGASVGGKKVGGISDMTILSFHPVKIITTGEGGAVLTNNEVLYKKMKLFMTHGITKENLFNASPGDWYYEMRVLGLNYRITDFQCALGLSQLKKIDFFLEERKKIAERYSIAFAGCSNLFCPPTDSAISKSSWHLYVVRLIGEKRGKRAVFFKRLKEAGIGVQVHYIPVYFHPYYQQLEYKKGLCPKAEQFYESIISLPIYPGLKEKDQEFVIDTFKNLLDDL